VKPWTPSPGDAEAARGRAMRAKHKVTAGFPSRWGGRSRDGGLAIAAAAARYWGARGAVAMGENRGSAARPLRGVVIMTFVATASVTEPVPRTPASRPNLVSVGTIIWLSSELMFFAALFAMYFTIRSVDKGQGLPWPMAHLNLPLGSTNTTVLVLSSVTCQMGVFAVERGQIRRAASVWNFMKWGLREWYVLSFLMGLYFVIGQAIEYSQLVSEDHLTLSSSNYGSVFYLTTGFHGLHVTGGLIAFLFLLGRTYVAKRFTHEQQVSAIVVSYYWHFVDVVWIGLFTTIYLIQ